MKSEKKGLARILAAGSYSAQGIASAWKNEEAFRQELILYCLLLPVLLFLPLAGSVKIALFCGNSLVLIVELLNSAIEAIVDLVSPDYHELAKRAKDMGSAAVMLTMIGAAAVWICILV